MKQVLGVILIVVLVVIGCRKDPVRPVLQEPMYVVDVPQGFPQIPIPENNEFTAEGVELGRHLFYDTRLSGDNTMACASCHFSEYAFSDTTAFSIGIDGLDGARNAMPIFNLAWSPELFWDGRAESLEAQALLPVQDPVEMHETWSNAVSKLQADPLYPQMFEDAFGSPGIDSTRASKAIAQFVRTIISGDSPFDRYLNTFDPSVLGADAFEILEGYQLFQRPDKGDCIHCHTDPISTRLLTDFSYRNNGLDSTHTDYGREEVTGLSSDRGKFKVPSLRNLTFTAPYMHDGRFETIDEVLDFYINDVKYSPTVDPVMYVVDSSGTGSLGAELSPIEKEKVKKFLLSLTDSSFIQNPDYKAP